MKKINCDTDSPKAEYERGLNDAWELIRRLRTTNPSDLIEIFDKSATYSVFEELSASEAIEKWKAWEKRKKQNEIKVGDEIVYADGVKGVVVGISKYNEEISVLNNKHDVPQLLNKNRATKTGRHFDQIAKVLEAII